MKRLSSLTATFALAAFGFAQETTEAATTELGTKPDLVQQAARDTSLLNGWDILKMLLALTVVIGLLAFVLPRFAKKLGGRFSASPDSSMRVEESANVGGGAIYVVKVRGRSLLVGSTQQSITCLADLTESDAKERSEPAFFELLDQETGKSQTVARKKKSAEELLADDEPNHAVVTPRGGQAATGDAELQKQLETLRRVQQRVQSNEAGKTPEPAASDATERIKRLLG